MWVKTAFAIGLLLPLAFAAGARADAREDLVNEVHEEVSKRNFRCSVVEYFTSNVCGGIGENERDMCNQTMEAITDFKSELLSASTRKRAVYRWWQFVSGDQERSDCMRKLIGKETYCKAVNVAAAYDPHRNCPDAGRSNSTCWLNRDFERGWYLFPTEEDDWTQRCKVEKTDPDFEE